MGDDEMNGLKSIRIAKGIKQKDIAEVLGITQSAYNHYESGRSQPDINTLKKLADFYNISVDDLLNYDDEVSFGRKIKEKPVPVFEDEIVLPIVASLQCGYGMSGDPFIYVGEHSVPKSFVKKYGKDLVLNYAVGKSMLPTIRPGDLMVCYPSDWWDDGTIVIVSVNDSNTVKRIYHAKDGGIDLIPDNPKYKIMHYTPSEIEEYCIHVLGHVITTIPPEIQPIPRRQ